MRFRVGIEMTLVGKALGHPFGEAEQFGQFLYRLAAFPAFGRALFHGWPPLGKKQAGGPAVTPLYLSISSVLRCAKLAGREPLAPGDPRVPGPERPAEMN